jgi:hypothetical protein
LKARRKKLALLVVDAVLHTKAILGILNAHLLSPHLELVTVGKGSPTIVVLALGLEGLEILRTGQSVFAIVSF